MEGSGVPLLPPAHPPPKKTLHITRIPDLHDLEGRISISCHNAVTISKNSAEKPSRAQSVRRMTNLSRLLNECSEQLGDNGNSQFSCCDNTREARDLLQCFNSHFSIGLDARRSEESWKSYLAFSKVLTRAKEKTNNFEIGNSFLRVKGAGRILSASTHMDYVQHIPRIEDQLKNLKKRIKLRKVFLTNEKREALHLLKACRRFRGFPNHGASRDCSCHEGDWDQTMWAELHPDPNCKPSIG